MSTENTAIHDLLAGWQRKPLEEDPTDDVLFAGSRREGMGGRRARGTEPPNLFAMPEPPPVAAPLPSPHLVVSLPRPFQQMPATGIDNPHLATIRVAKTTVTRASYTLYAIPVGLGVVAAVLLAIYLGGDEKQPTVSASTVPGMTVVSAPPPKAATPSVGPIAEAAPAVAPIAAAPPAPVAEAPVAAVASAGDAPAGPTVTPIEPAPGAAMPKDAVAPPEVVPASAFAAKHEPTLPTVPAATAATPAAAEVVEAAPAPAKVKKSRRELAREKRAAKRAQKRGKRDTKKVAAVERPAKVVTDAKLNGNGALAIASAQPREVWVDGRNSKRMTPLRVLLKPGKHKVTLFDKAKGTAKTFDVEIKPNETTKVSK